MKFAFVTLITLIMAAMPVHATWEVGLSSVAPTGDFGDVAGGGGGLFVAKTINETESASFDVSVAAIAYGGVEVGGGEIQWYGYPISVGTSYYPGGADNGGLFLRGEGGLLVKTGSIEIFGVEVDESETGTVFSLGAGWTFSKANLSAVYNVGSDDWTWFGIDLSYRFGQ